MAKDKDDSDASPTTTALGGNNGKQQELPPSLSSAIKASQPMSFGKPIQFDAFPPNTPSTWKNAMAEAVQAMNSGPQDEVSSPSDPNSPNTTSTEGHGKTQPQSDDEILGHPEIPPPGLTPPSSSPMEDKEESWAMITEPDPATLHPDIDLTDRNNLTRLLALLQSGWVLERGRGPRNHDKCLWCRGPIDADLDMLTHVGADDGSSCRNSWPASCLMDWINHELDVANCNKMKCPMCSAMFYKCATKTAANFKDNQGKTASDGVLNAAWLRCQLFSPAFARDSAIKQGKPLIFMKGTEARKLVFLGKEKVIFDGSEGLLNPIEAESKRKFLRRHYGGTLPYTVEQLTGMLGVGQSEATAIIQSYNQGLSVPHSTLPTDAPLELTPQFDTTWVLIDRGNNQFIMSVFLTEQAYNMIWLPCELENCNIKNMTAEEFEAQARENGGLVAAVKSYDPTEDEDFKRHRVLAEGWLQHLIAKNKPDGVAGPKDEFFKRVKDAHDVKLEHTLTNDEGGEAGDDDDEWEDDGGF